MSDDSGPLLKTPPAHAAADWTIPQDWVRYTAAEHAMWDRLFARQVDLLRSRVAPEFLAGLDALELNRPGIPDFERLAERLMKANGWRGCAGSGAVVAGRLVWS